MPDSKEANKSAKAKSGAAPDAVKPSCAPKQNPNGKIDLHGVAIMVKHDVCDDKIANFSDYKKLFLLKEGKKLYHWLKHRTDPDDTTKPGIAAGPIPVTISSKASLRLSITFKTIEPLNGFFIKVTDTANKYKFHAAQATPNNSGAKGALFDVTVTCDNPLPYQGAVQYLPNFSLSIAYSKDGSGWTNLGTAVFCLYITLDEPGFNALSPADDNTDEEMTLLINNKTTFRPTILESLLYIGCKHAAGAKTASEVITRIFNHIKTLNVGRARYPAAMGYWRNKSSLHIDNMPFRNGRVLLKTGEARCGEWTAFLGDLLFIQSKTLFFGKLTGFPIINNAAVTAPGFINSGFLVKPWVINGNLAPVDKRGRAQDLKNIPLNIFWDHVFLLYNNQYFDPSYGITSGISFADEKKLLNHYAGSGLAGIVLSQISSANKETAAIAYLPLPGKFIEPQLAYKLTTTAKNKYRYNIIKSNMEKYLISPPKYRSHR